jgi:hypothetical protein
VVRTVTGVTVPRPTPGDDLGMIAIWIALGVATLLIASVFCLMIRIDSVVARLDGRIDAVGDSSRH